MISGYPNDPKSKCNSRRHLKENKGHSGGSLGNNQECHRNYQGQSYGQVKGGACSLRTRSFNYFIFISKISPCVLGTLLNNILNVI